MTGRHVRGAAFGVLAEDSPSLAACTGQDVARDGSWCYDLAACPRHHPALYAAVSRRRLFGLVDPAYVAGWRGDLVRP